MTNQSSEKVLPIQLQTTSNDGYKFSWFDWFCLWYPPGWLILFNRHWQHYHKYADGWNWLEYILFLLPGGFYLALLMRWLRLGCRSPRKEFDEFDPNYQQAFRTEILAPIAAKNLMNSIQIINKLFAQKFLLLLPKVIFEENCNK